MNILVVDDETDMQSLFEQRFRKEIQNHIIHFAFANSGEKALDYLELHHHKALLILSDINMPGMSGLDLLKQTKKKYAIPSLVIMMITAYSNEESYGLAMKSGANGFLTRPVDFGVLKQKIKH